MHAMSHAAPDCVPGSASGEAFLDALRRFAFLDLEFSASAALAAAVAPPAVWSCSARVSVTGAPDCTVTLLAAPEFAALAARNYTALDGEPGVQLRDDTLRELANIAAGALFERLSGGERPADIAPPTACSDPAAVWSALPPEQRWVLDCDGQPALAILVELPATRARGPAARTGGPAS
jgi:hypothetical protein